MLTQAYSTEVALGQAHCLNQTITLLLRQHKIATMRRKSVCILRASSSGGCIIAITRIRAKRRVLALSLATPKCGEELLLLPGAVSRAVVMLVQMIQHGHRLVWVDRVIAIWRGWDGRL